MGLGVDAHDRMHVACVPTCARAQVESYRGKREEAQRPRPARARGAAVGTHAPPDPSRAMATGTSGESPLTGPLTPSHTGAHHTSLGATLACVGRRTGTTRFRGVLYREEAQMLFSLR